MATMIVPKAIDKATMLNGSPEQYVCAKLVNKLNATKTNTSHITVTPMFRDVKSPLQRISRTTAMTADGALHPDRKQGDDT